MDKLESTIENHYTGNSEFMKFVYKVLTDAKSLTTSKTLFLENSIIKYVLKYSPNSNKMLLLYMKFVTIMKFYGYDLHRDIGYKCFYYDILDIFRSKPIKLNIKTEKKLIISRVQLIEYVDYFVEKLDNKYYILMNLVISKKPRPYKEIILSEAESADIYVDIFYTLGDKDPKKAHKIFNKVRSMLMYYGYVLPYCDNKSIIS